MTRTTIKTPRPRLLSAESMWRMLLAICVVHGIGVSLRGEAASGIADSIYNYEPPCRKVQALAHRIVRPCVEGNPGVAPWTIPKPGIQSHTLVCPRCGAAGYFQVGAGGCECGYSC